MTRASQQLDNVKMYECRGDYAHGKEKTIMPCLLRKETPIPGEYVVVFAKSTSGLSTLTVAGSDTNSSKQGCQQPLGR